MTLTLSSADRAILRRSAAAWAGAALPTSIGSRLRLADDVKAIIMGAANDPLNAAIRYGKVSGECSCCGRELTDPKSIEAGIGPICATKFGW